jgi:ubiquinone biosynthesis protein COQ4
VSWRRALRALRELLDDPDRTEKAFEVFAALNGDEEERAFQRFRAHPTGASLLRERPSLLARLCDRAALANLPPGSFGAAYLAHVERTGLSADGLVRLKEQMEAHAAAIGEQLPALDPAREWFRVRGLLTHDLWHVLTGYETDSRGETYLLAFSLAQLPGRANRLLTVGAGLRGVRDEGLGLIRGMYAAWQRGRRAVWLPALPYETLLPIRLDEVRGLAAIV